MNYVCLQHKQKELLLQSTLEKLGQFPAFGSLFIQFIYVLYAELITRRLTYHVCCPIYVLIMLVARKGSTTQIPPKYRTD